MTVRTLTITRAIYSLYTCIPNAALLVPVLIRHPIRKDVVANFDPIIYQLIRETEVMKKMGLDIPDEGQRLLYMQKGLKEKHSKLVVSHFFWVNIFSVTCYIYITSTCIFTASIVSVFMLSQATVFGTF